MKRLSAAALPFLAVAVLVFVTGCGQDNPVDPGPALETQEIAADATTASKECNPPDCEDDPPSSPPTLTYASHIGPGQVNPSKIYGWTCSLVPVTYYKLAVKFTTKLDGSTIDSLPWTNKYNTRNHCQYVNGGIGFRSAAIDALI